MNTYWFPFIGIVFSFKFTADFRVSKQKLYGSDGGKRKKDLLASNTH